MDGNYVKYFAKIIELEYNDGQWMVRGVWDSSMKKELLKRIQTIQSTKISNKKGARIEQTAQQLEKTQEPDTTYLTENQQLTVHVQQLTENYQQSILQIQTLRTEIEEKDGIIRRNDVTIAEQQREIARYRNNPHWMIERDEVEITEEVLGRGGWGEVKVGIFRGTKVAVKCLHQMIVSEYYLQLFSREMDIASRVRHPNLLQFIGATREVSLILVTELMPTSLRNELEKNRMLRNQIVAVSVDVASALNYLHLWRPHPILHRDVSSANVLLESSGCSQWKAKLSDYGSVNLLGNIQTANPGSPMCSAPEASNPTQHSPAMDIYSFGILMTEMATGLFPVNVSFEREAQIRSVKWPAIQALIVRCTASDPLSRPSTSSVLDQLKELSLDEYNRP